MYQELNMLDDVVNTETTGNTVILGDFNADCDYLSDDGYNSLELNDVVTWLIDKNADTNVAATSCAYDRIAHRGTLNFAGSAVDTASLGSHISDHYLVHATLTTSASTYKIAAFNLQRFGQTKAADPTFVSTVRSVISRYDVVLLQEITDTNQTLINNLVPSGYSFSLSPQLGTTSYKEQYAYVYSVNAVDIPTAAVATTNVCKEGFKPTQAPASPPASCTSDGYDCGTSRYWTGAQCRATKGGMNKRVRDCCCGK